MCDQILHISWFQAWLYRIRFLFTLIMIKCCKTLLHPSNNCPCPMYFSMLSPSILGLPSREGVFGESKGFIYLLVCFTAVKPCGFQDNVRTRSLNVSTFSDTACTVSRKNSFSWLHATDRQRYKLLTKKDNGLAFRGKPSKFAVWLGLLTSYS